MRYSVITFSLFLPFFMKGQIDTVYTRDYLEKSTKFAWTTLGIEMFNLTGGSTQYLESGLVNSLDFGPSFSPRVTIGGIHFWGHTDFYVTFPLNSIQLQSTPDELRTLEYTNGIETGARVYPWKVRPNSIRPFVGVSFRRITYSQEDSVNDYPYGGSTKGKVIYPVQAGVSYTKEGFMFTAVAHWQRFYEFDYYLSEEQTGKVSLNPVTFNIGFIKYWDIDRYARTDKGIEQENLRHKVLAKENKLSTWYFGVGPSAGFQMSSSPLITESYPYLSTDRFVSIMPDITFGRYFSKPDINVGLSFRRFNDRLEAFDSRVEVTRNSYMIEAYNFLFNWLGFVPFLGVTGSLEQLRVDENGDESTELKPALGLIAGWDIRVTKTGTSLLRTNLRYIPKLHTGMDSDKMMFDHLEINFIQWVYFFGRKKALEKYSN